MIRRHQGRPQTSRRGATVLECAIIFPVFFLLLIGLMVGGLGVFRYQELASLTREAARYASVRGQSYELHGNQKAITAKDVYDKVIVPSAVGLDMSKLKYSVTWNPDNRQGSQVTVTLTYKWIPEAFLGGITLSSSATMTVSY